MVWHQHHTGAEVSLRESAEGEQKDLGQDLAIGRLGRELHVPQQR
jgi:hypothetical protein